MPGADIETEIRFLPAASITLSAGGSGKAAAMVFPCTDATAYPGLPHRSTANFPLAFRTDLCSCFVHDPAHPLSAPARFALILDGLYRAVAARIAAKTITAALIILICGRLRRIDTQLQALIARFRAGTLRVMVATPPLALK